jgi:colanic acid/amylovoran biosynthesis glycosyltransferase
VSRYPLVSQTFIRREVNALRAEGLVVSTASVHATPESQLFGALDRAAAQETWTVLGRGRPELLLRLLLAGLVRVPAVSRQLVTGWRRGRGLRAKARQCFYVLEALLVLVHCRSIGVRHLHVHFANNAADIARHVAALGNGEEPGTWSWSFTMHGPTEFADVERFDLAGKAADASYVVCISNFARSQLMAITDPEVWQRFRVVHCGVDLAEYARVRTRPSATELRVLCVGRLVPEKGQILLVEAVGRMRDQGVAVTLTLVGQGPTRPVIEALITRLDLSANIQLVGAMSPEEVTTLYSQHDAFCLPSFAEGIPIVLMEAMASGLPVVTTQIAGIPELVAHDDSGLLVPPGDVDALVDALIYLAQSEERRRELGNAGRQAIRREFDLRSCASELARVHASAAARYGRVLSASS